MKNFIEEGFHSHEIWTAIKEISTSNLPKKVASAYIGKNANFNWQNGDTLVVALSKKNVRHGIVDPRELQQIRNLGVKIYKQEDLHAKVYFNGEKVVVCSCNLSGASQGSSEESYLEAGIFTSESGIIASVEKFFKNLVDDQEPVSLEELTSYIPLFGTEKSQPAEAASVKETHRVWIANTHSDKTRDIDTSNKVNTIREEVKLRIRATFYELHSFTSYGNNFDSARSGDIFILFHNDEGDINNLNVYPPLLLDRIVPVDQEKKEVCLLKPKGRSFRAWNEIKDCFSEYQIVVNGPEMKEHKFEIVTLLSSLV